jgi:hypothetical protein
VSALIFHGQRSTEQERSNGGQLLLKGQHQSGIQRVVANDASSFNRKNHSSRAGKQKKNQTKSQKKKKKDDEQAIKTKRLPNTSIRVGGSLRSGRKEGGRIERQFHAHTCFGFELRSSLREDFAQNVFVLLSSDN